MVLLNGLISIFGHSFDSQVEIEQFELAEKGYRERKRREAALKKTTNHKNIKAILPATGIEPSGIHIYLSTLYIVLL